MLHTYRFSLSPSPLYIYHTTSLSLLTNLTPTLFPFNSLSLSLNLSSNGGCHLAIPSPPPYFPYALLPLPLSPLRHSPPYQRYGSDVGLCLRRLQAHHFSGREARLRGLGAPQGVRQCRLLLQYVSRGALCQGPALRCSHRAQWHKGPAFLSHLFQFFVCFHINSVECWQVKLSVTRLVHTQISPLTNESGLECDHLASVLAQNFHNILLILLYCALFVFQSTLVY